MSKAVSVSVQHQLRCTRRRRVLDDVSRKHETKFVLNTSIENNIFKYKTRASASSRESAKFESTEPWDEMGFSVWNIFLIEILYNNCK